MKKTIISAALSFLLVGCQTTPPSPMPVSEVQMDKASAFHYRCLSYEIKPLENHLIEAQAQIQNRDSSSHTLRYRADWYSEAGNYLGASNWDLRLVQPSEIFFITVVAHDASAAKIRMYLK